MKLTPDEAIKELARGNYVCHLDLDKMEFCPATAKTNPITFPNVGWYLMVRTPSLQKHAPEWLPVPMSRKVVHLGSPVYTVCPAHLDWTDSSTDEYNGAPPPKGAKPVHAGEELVFSTNAEALVVRSWLLGITKDLQDRAPELVPNKHAEVLHDFAQGLMIEGSRRGLLWAECCKHVNPFNEPDWMWRVKKRYLIDGGETDPPVQVEEALDEDEVLFTIDASSEDGTSMIHWDESLVHLQQLRKAGLLYRTREGARDMYHIIAWSKTFRVLQPVYREGYNGR